MRAEHDQSDDLQLLTVKQAAQRLGCSLTNVYNLIDSGQLAVVPVGQRKGYRIDMRDLGEFVDQRKFRFQAPLPIKTSVQLKHIKRQADA